MVLFVSSILLVFFLVSLILLLLFFKMSFPKSKGKDKSSKGGENRVSIKLDEEEVSSQPHVNVIDEESFRDPLGEFSSRTIIKVAFPVSRIHTLGVWATALFLLDFRKS